MATSPCPLDSSPEVERDLRLVLDWLRGQYGGGRARTFPPLLISPNPSRCLASEPTVGIIRGPPGPHCGHGFSMMVG